MAAPKIGDEPLFFSADAVKTEIDSRTNAVNTQIRAVLTQTIQNAIKSMRVKGVPDMPMPLSAFFEGEPANLKLFLQSEVYRQLLSELRAGKWTLTLRVEGKTLSGTLGSEVFGHSVGTQRGGGALTEDERLVEQDGLITGW